MANNDMEKILVSITVERALIDVGGADLHQSVQNWLYSEYRYHFSDCLEHPESLLSILQKKCGDQCGDIVYKIHGLLGDVSQREPFQGFVKKIGKI